MVQPEARHHAGTPLTCTNGSCTERGSREWHPSGALPAGPNEQRNTYGRYARCSTRGFARSLFERGLPVTPVFLSAHPGVRETRGQRRTGHVRLRPVHIPAHKLPRRWTVVCHSELHRHAESEPRRRPTVQTPPIRFGQAVRHGIRWPWDRCEYVPDRHPGNCERKPAGRPERILMAKNRRLSSDEFRLLALVISALEPIAKLLDAISRIR